MSYFRKKSSEGYRRNLLEAYQGSAENKLQHIYIKKQFEALLHEKKSWILEKEELEEVIRGFQTQEEVLKRNN
jgi:hypothetical protein